MFLTIKLYLHFQCLYEYKSKSSFKMEWNIENIVMIIIISKLINFQH